MDALVSIVSACIACCIIVLGMFLLVRFEMRLQIKGYNKRHEGKFDEHTSPWVMSKRYQDWYVENFANMKEGYFDTEKEGNTHEK